MRGKSIFVLFVVFLLIFSVRISGNVFDILPQVQKGVVISPTSNSFTSCSTVFPFKQDDKFTYFLSCAHGFDELSTLMEDRISAIIGTSPLVIRHCQIDQIGVALVMSTTSDYVVLKAPKMRHDKPLIIKKDVTNIHLLNNHFKVIAGEHGGRIKIYEVRVTMCDDTHFMFEPSLDPGASGSPIINDKNEVVGMVEGITKFCGIAIKINKIPLDEVRNTPFVTNVGVISR